MAASLKRRSRRNRRGKLSEINVTPFVDVMLVLLIVFMVTAPLLTAGVDLQLPRTDAKGLAQAQDPLTISVQADGSIYLQETRTPESELIPRLKAIAAAGYEERVFVRADGRVSYEAVARVLALVSSGGFTRVGLVTDPMPKTGASTQTGPGTQSGAP